MNVKSLSWTIGVVLLSSVVLLGGCVPSLNAIYTDQDTVFDPNVLGTWKQDNSTEMWEFQERDAKSYRLVYTDREGHSGAFLAHLADVQGVRFLDLFPEQIEDQTPGFYRFHQVPIHSIYLVKELSGDQVVLASIDYQWLDQYVKDHPDKLASATFGSRWMITAPTEQLQQFLVTHKARFTNDFQLQRQTSASVN